MSSDNAFKAYSMTKHLPSYLACTNVYYVLHNFCFPPKIFYNQWLCFFFLKKKNSLNY